MAAKVLQSGHFWPKLYRNANTFVKMCSNYQMQGNTSRKHELPLSPILEVELLDV